jgi:hypothetical protein
MRIITAHKLKIFLSLRCKSLTQFFFEHHLSLKSSVNNAKGERRQKSRLDGFAKATTDYFLKFPPPQAKSKSMKTMVSSFKDVEEIVTLVMS